MKRILNKSLAFVLFGSAISFVLTFGMALLAFIQSIQIDADSAGQDSRIVFFALALLVLLLCLNTADIIGFWLRGKTQEIKVKNLVGIAQVHIYFPLYLNLNLLIILSAFIGMAAAMGCALSGFITIKVTLSGCLCSLLFCMGFLNLFFTIILWRKLRCKDMEP